jgi:hypothetical protein
VIAMVVLVLRVENIKIANDLPTGRIIGRQNEFN